MANITATGSFSNITVSTSAVTIPVSDTTTNVTVTNVATVSANVGVTSTSSNIVVSGVQAISNVAIRSALGNVNPILYNASTGIFSIDSDALFTGKTTDDLTEGSTNKYFTTTGATVNTDALPEGSTNKYYTNARVLAYVTDAGLDFNAEKVDDRVANLMQTTGNLTFTYDDGANTLTLSESLTTDDIDEGTKLYFTNGRARSAINVNDTGGDGSLSYSSGSGVITYTGPSAAEVRAHFSGGTGVDYSSSTGVIAIGQNVSTTSDVIFADVTADQFVQQYYDTGNVSGSVSFDLDNGSLQKCLLVGNITGISFSNLQTGGSISVILTQDSVGYRLLDTTTTPSNWTSWEFANDWKELNTNANEEDVLTVIYNGSKYYASITPLREFLVSNSGLANSNITVNGTTINLGSSGNISNFGTLTTDDLTQGSTNLYFTNSAANSAITTYFGDNANSPFTINGNLQVAGNIDYVNVEDLLVNDQSITLNYGNATARDAFIYVDRSGSALNNAHIKWNETSDQWEIYDGTTTYKIPVSTDDLAEGVTNKYYATSLFNTDFATKTTSDLTEGTNLYWTTDRGNTNSDAWLTTKSTTDLAEGTNLYFSNTNLATSSTTHLPEGTNLYYTDARVDSHLSGGYGITYTSGVIETTNAEIQAQANVAFGNNTTDNLTEGATNLYYTDSKVDTHLNTGTATTGEVLSWTGSDYDWVAQTGGTSYSNANVADYLLDTGIQKKAHTVFVQDLALSPDAANAQLGFYFPNGSGTTGQVLKFDSATQLTQAFLDTGNVTETTNLYYTTDRANSAIEAHTGSIANLTGNVVTTGNITGDYVFATTRFQGDINGAIQNEVWNASGGTLNKGDIVALNGNNHGSTPDVVLADAGNASLMPGFGVVKNEILSTETGEVVISGSMNFAVHGFTVGAQLYVNGAGQFTETAPQGEANLLQKIATVTNSNTINVAGAGRTNATPNLDDGNIFLGNGSNESVSAVLDTSIVPENGNLYYTDARVQSNTAADTGLVHTTGAETVGGDKTFTDLINVVPSGSTDGITITNENSSTPFILQSNSAGGVRLIWTQANDSADGGDITAFKSRGSLGAATATEFGDSVFDFFARPSTTNNNKTGVGFGFDVEHTTATSGDAGGAVNTVFTQTSQDNAFVDNRAYYTSKGSFKIGPGVVDINSDQLRNRGDTVIGNGGDTNYISFADTEAKLIFDKSNVSSTNNVSIKISGWNNRAVFDFFGITVGTYGYRLGDNQSVFINIDRVGSEFNGDKYLPDGLPVTIGGTILADAANASGQTYYIRKYFDDGPVTGDNTNNVYYELYTDSALTTGLTWNDLVPSPGVYYYNYPAGGYLTYSTKSAQGNVFVDSYTTTGSGTGSKFQVNRYNGSYNTINFATPSGGYGGVYAPNPGTGHVVGDTITIDGADLKGITGTNNLTFTVDSVSSGAITSIGNISGTAYQITDQEWSFEMDQTTDNLYVKDDGVTKFTFTPDGVKLKQFAETVVALGNQSGNVSANIDAVNGSIYTMTANGNVTIDSIPNAQPGSSYTLKITQDGTGNRLLTSGFKYLGGNATLSTGAGNIDVVSVVYDGTDYLASLSHDYK